MNETTNETTQREDLTRGEIEILVNEDQTLPQSRRGFWARDLLHTSLLWYRAQIAGASDAANTKLMELIHDRVLFRNAAEHALRRHDKWETQVSLNDQSPIYINTPEGRRSHTQAEVREAIDEAMYARVNDLSDAIAKKERELEKLIDLLETLDTEVASR